MEELRRLATEYYSRTVSFKYYGLKGFLYLSVSVPLLILSFYLNLKISLSFLIIAPMLVAAAFWMLAEKEYEKNLIFHISFYTHLQTKSVDEQKAAYLSLLTSHVAGSLFDSMKIFKEIVETNNKNKSFVLDNGWYHFFKFIYDPDSKNRILSLIIYLISLVAMLTVVKPQTNIDFYEIIQIIDWEQLIGYFLGIALMIIMFYVVIVVPIMFLITYLVVPVMLVNNSKVMLNKFFISELNKYAFLEQRGIK